MSRHMTLQEAFERVEHLPQKDRVLLGVFGDEADSRWSSFDAESLGLLDELVGTNELGNQVARAVEEFREGSAKSVVLIMQIADSSHAVLALGPVSPSSVAEAVSDAYKQLVARYAH